MRKACKQCRMLVESGICPICNNSDFASNWTGRVSVIDVEKSVVAKKLALTKNGDYAIKVR